MKSSKSGWAQLFTGLSARLLVLTIFFVMLSEVFIYAPSVARYRLTYMQERIAAAHLASLALEAPSDNLVSAELMTELLDHARSYGIVLRRPQSKALMLSNEMPNEIAATYDLRKAEFFPLIMEAFMTLGRSGKWLMRVIAPSPKDSQILVETIIDEAPMRAEMFDYSRRILALSLVISFMTASLVYLSLHWMLVRPMLGLTDSMVAFRRDPENAASIIEPGGRTDEVGRAQRELADMQGGLRKALQQREHLAALGSAVTKISHDLRNILATAQLVSDGLAVSKDPNVTRAAPRLFSAIDRAVKLCGETLKFAHEGTPPPQRARFDLSVLYQDVADTLAEPNQGKVSFHSRIDGPFEISADRDQIYRVLLNLLMNACEAGADQITVDAVRENGEVTIEITDNGPGLPQKVRENLFKAFAGSGRAGGTGLGLAIARDLMRGHGGDIDMAKTSETGTVFRLRLPAGDPPPARARPTPEEGAKVDA